jgi:hypothetical protein
VIPVLALYVLRLKRPERPISSTLLWRGIVEDMRANAPWQRLRISLLLAVQILTVAALALTLAQPAFSRSQEFAGDVVLVLDQSYSMQATDASPSRFSQAQQRARSIASELTATSAVSVIGMGHQPVLAIAQSTDSGAVGSAISRLKPGTRAVNVPAALSLAASLARPGKRTQVVILTDHSSRFSAGSLHLPYPVTVIRFGARRRDLGILGFAASGGTYTHALARIHNFGSASASSDLQIYGDGQLLDVRPLTVAPGHTTTLSWDQLPAGLTRLQARLTRRDDMPEDKTAWAVVPTPAQRHVLLVTQSNYYLETALVLDPSVTLQVVTPAGYRAAAPSGADVTIFDGVVPARPVPSALLVNPPPGRWPGMTVGPLVPGGTLSTRRSAPRALTRYANISNVHIDQTRIVHPAHWLRTVLRVGSTPAVLAGQRGATREVIIGFALQDSDWPLRISFPLFMHDIVQYLAPGITLGSTTVQLGAPVAIGASPGAGTLVVTRPDGRTDSLHAPFAPFTDTLLPGVYSVRSQPPGAAPLLFAVNSFPPDRTDASAPNLSRSGAGSSAAVSHVVVPVDVAWAAGLLVLALLGLEWWIGMRD